MKYSILIFSFLFTILSNASSYISVIDGDWSNPTTWGETTMIPLIGDEVIINHTVTITDQYTVDGYWSISGASASITIAENGILQTGQNVLGIAMQNGASITNNGQLNMSQLGNYDGIFTNNGTSTLSQLIYNLDEIVNNGDILGIDSLYTSGSFTNNANANIYADSLLIDLTGTFINIGNLYLHEFTNNAVLENSGLIEFRRFTNAGLFTNTGNLQGSLDATNSGHLILVAGSVLRLENSFSNSDEINHEALLEIDGDFLISNSFTNRDTVKGQTGYLEIQQNSSNLGWIKGNFQFCDNSPMAEIRPFIDVNSGVFESTVIFCQDVGVEEFNNESIGFYPNPSNGSLRIINAEQVKLVDLTGKVVLDKEILKETELDIRELEKGIYIITLTNKERSVVRRLLVE